MDVQEQDPAQWFQPVGRCSCGRPAQGTVRDGRNEVLGVACIRCGEAGTGHRAQIEFRLKIFQI